MSSQASVVISTGSCEVATYIQLNVSLKIVKNDLKLLPKQPLPVSKRYGIKNETNLGRPRHSQK